MSDKFFAFQKKVRKASITEWTGTEKLSPRLFESRSKQCWLDVILQTYKCFVLTSISQIKVRKESFSVSTPPSRRSTVHRASVITSSLLKYIFIFSLYINNS